MKFKNQVNLVYDGRTQQKGRAANDDQEGAQESSLGGEGDGCVWKCSVSYSGRLHTRTHGSTGIKLYIERRLHLIVCELNLTGRDRLSQVGAGF